MSQSDETRSITRSINVVDADVEAFHKLHEKGVKLTAQMVPNDPVEDFMKLLK
jgi:phosphotransferase system sugar-specific EIIB component, putative